MMYITECAESRWARMKKVTLSDGRTGQYDVILLHCEKTG